MQMTEMIHYVKNSLVLALLIVGAISVSAVTDELVLRSGQTANRKILDTAGCSIRVENDRGIRGEIKKEMIQKVIWNSDTIDYSQYKCQEKPKKVMRFQDTPEYKLMAFVDNAKTTQAPFLSGSKLAFLHSPLQGNFDPVEFVEIQKALFGIFAMKAEVAALGCDEIYDIVRTKQPEFRYAFIPRLYHVDVHAYVPNKLETIAALGRENAERASNRKREVVTTADICLVDLAERKIVFRERSARKRRVYGESEFSWNSILTPDEWEKKWQDDQTGRKIDRNAETIKRRLSESLLNYVEGKE